MGVDGDTIYYHINKNTPMKKKICIKIGSNVLSYKDGALNIERIENIVFQISELRKKGYQPILVSSGAVATGRKKVKISDKYDPVSARQLWSSVGQVELMNIYCNLFSQYGLICAQVLVTKTDFSTREHYLNMKNCLTTLLSNNIIPIINENDAVSVTALMFTDNDELSGLLASMMNVDTLFILSNIDGIYNGDPNNLASRVIHRVNGNFDEISQFISVTKSNFGRGGMLTKARIAYRVAKSGIRVIIANGSHHNILLKLLKTPNSIPHTTFMPGQPTSNVKKWLACSEGFAKAKVFINEGAKQALASCKATSLLPIGVTKIQGEFSEGDIIKIVTHSGKTIGLGKARYNHQTAIISIGKKEENPIIHYDYLFLL